MRHGERHCAQPVALGISRGSPASQRARRCRAGKTGIRLPPASAVLTASPRSRAPSSMHPIFAPPIFPGWPANTSHAMLIRAPDATHVYTGIDLARLSGALKPSVVVTAADLAQDRHPRSRILCRRPVLPGRQDAALSRPAGGAVDLREVRRLRPGAARAARRHVREVRRGNRPRRDAELWRLSLHARGRPDARRARYLFAAPGRLGQSGPFREHGAADLDAARRIPTGAPMPTPRPTASRSAPNSQRTIRLCWCWTANSRRNPSIRCFLSRNAASPGTTRAPRISSSCSACSRPTRPRSRSRSCWAKRGAPFKPARINSHFTYVGGGFGGRDHTPFPLYVALAAMFFPGRPVRLAHDRYQQFQAGIKRHAFQDAHADRRRSRDRQDQRLRRGSRPGWRRPRQLFGQRSDVSAPPAAIGIYDIPKVDVTTVAFHSRGVTAGSMRGYGTLQTMTALEVLIDEAATALPLDPIEFRRRNALKTGRPNHDRQSVQRLGPHAGDPGQAGAASDLAAARRRERPAASRPGCSSAPAWPASPRTTAPARTVRWGRVEIDPEGRITIHCDHVEMGNGIGTALANRVATHLGGVADEVTVAQVDAFDALALVTSGDAYTMNQATQDAAQRNPRWVPAISSATSASIGAHVGTQRRPRPRASCSGSDCGRRRSSCGASRRPIRGPGSGRRRAGKMGISSCRGWRRWRCRRSPQGRTRARS